MSVIEMCDAAYAEGRKDQLKDSKELIEHLASATENLIETITDPDGGQFDIALAINSARFAVKRAKGEQS